VRESSNKNLLTMASYDKTIESYKKTVTTAASVAASLMLMRGVVNELVPYEVRDLLFSGFGYLRSNMSSQHTIIVERKSDGFINNHVYDAVKTYLATRIDTSLQQRVRVSTMDESDKIMVSMAEGDEMVDMYEGTEFKWCLICRESSSDSSNNGIGSLQEVSYEVSFHKKHKEKALESYLPFILATAKAIKDQEKSLRIFMNEYDTWSPIDLHHPSTFDTLAMDLKLKQSIIDDLNRFIKRKDYYKRIGKAWKRGYLLYGPPGTGKSSLIVAMANHLRFDIYDLELTEVDSNSDLRRLLVGMSNRSILVVEDIDCTIELKQREEGEGRDRSSSTTEENKGEDKVSNFES
jgi:mitochondrial chaperone BCS1